MDPAAFTRVSETKWRREPTGSMVVPVVVYADEPLLRDMDDKVLEQATNVAGLPGIVRAVYVMPDGHWGYGFPIGGVAAFDPDGGVVSAGGVGFDISCGVRCLTTGLREAQVAAVRDRLAEALFRRVPAGVGSTGAITLNDDEMTSMLRGGAQWAVERGLGGADDLARTEEQGRMAGALPEHVSTRARQRQRQEMGTLGSGNHYLELQVVRELFDAAAARRLGIEAGAVLLSIHCGSRGLGHQIGTDYLREMVEQAPAHGLALPDRELACAPIRSALGARYLGAMRAGINCALANRQILTHLVRGVIGEFFPDARLDVVYDVSHNTCKEEEHTVDGATRRLFVHRKGATRALGPGHPLLPPELQAIGQPVLIGGSMGTESWLLLGTPTSETAAFASACHGAGRRMSRNAAARRWRGDRVVRDLAGAGIVVRSPSPRGVAEEAPGAYKDVGAVVHAAERAGLARRLARLVPVICIKG
jgi:tRNA-splicing ligase RtcB